MNEALFKKYNVPVPRYTSYPTANEFEAFDAQRYLKAVEASNNAITDNISFYTCAFLQTSLPLLRL